MDFYEALDDWLKTRSWAALVRSKKHGVKIWPDAAPASAKLPYVTYEQIAAPGHRHLRGVSRIRSDTISFSAWGRSSREARAIGKAMRADLYGDETNPEGARGAYVGAALVRDLALESDQRTTEPTGDAGERSNHRARLDLTWWYIP